jgi:hypothetical protein
VALEDEAAVEDLPLACRDKIGSSPVAVENWRRTEFRKQSGVPRIWRIRMGIRRRTCLSPGTTSPQAGKERGEGMDRARRRSKHAAGKTSGWVACPKASRRRPGLPSPAQHPSTLFLMVGYRRKKNQLIESLLVRGKYMCSPEASCVCTTFKKEKNNEEKSSKLAACRLPLQENKINVGPDWEKQSL